MQDTKTLIFKVATAENFETARGEAGYLGMPVDDADGYMHFSTAAQLRETVRRYFAGQTELVLLGVDVGAIGEDLRWEPSRGGDLFPHLYAPLPLDAITHSAPLSVEADGSAALPDWAQA
jgi:uncharacterized protein (DUF952 family)